MIFEDATPTVFARELQELVKNRTAKYKYPRWVEFVHDLPKTATGKIQRYKLRELGAAARWLHDQQR